MTPQDHPASAQNPWHCGTTSPLPPMPWPDGGPAGPPLRRDDLLRLIARRLYDWPDDRPLRLHPEEERLRRLLDTIAGYPEIAPGSLPFDQPFRVEAAEAIELALALDAWPPLAGRHSLRAELLWLDRVQRSGRPVAGRPLDAAEWLQVVVAWLIAGLTAPEQSEPDADIVLLDLLYDPEERSDAGGFIRSVAALLARRPPRDDLGAFANPGAAARSQDQLGARAQWLWWCRHGAPIAGTPSPELGLDESRWTVEVTFHRVQAWMTTPPEGHDPDGPDRRLQRLFGTMVRGASDLLEATMSALRSTLLARLGPGALLVDGGARLCFRCPPTPQGRAALEAAIHATIDGLLAPAGGLGRRYAGVLALLARQRFLRSGDERAPSLDALEQRQRLAWSALPPLSVTFVERTEHDPLDAGTGPVRVPIRRTWPMPVEASLPPAPRSERRRDFRMTLPARLRAEIGVQAPRERLLRVRFRDTARGVEIQKLPSVRTLFRQIFVADLNRIGAFLSRPRETSFDPEATARRSFRFTAHWLSAVTRAVVAVGKSDVLEVLVLGGDDLIVGSRLDGGDLQAFAAALHAELARFNAELPPCDGVSFSAGLIDAGAQGPNNRRSLESAFQLRDVAKQHWRSTIDGTAPDSLAVTVTTLPGESSLRSSLVVVPSGGAAASAGDETADAAVAVSRRLDIGPDAEGVESPFSGLAAALRSSLPELLGPAADADPPRRFELVAEGQGGGPPRLTLVQFEVTTRARWTMRAARCVACVRPSDPA